MITQFHRKSRAVAVALAAFAMVALSGLTFEYGHQGALPKGVIEVGELQQIVVGEIAMLPGIEVIGRRASLLAGEAGAADGQG